ARYVRGAARSLDPHPRPPATPAAARLVSSPVLHPWRSCRATRVSRRRLVPAGGGLRRGSVLAGGGRGAGGDDGGGGGAGGGGRVVDGAGPATNGEQPPYRTIGADRGPDRTPPPPPSHHSRRTSRTNLELEREPRAVFRRRHRTNRAAVTDRREAAEAEGQR